MQKEFGKVRESAGKCGKVRESAGKPSSRKGNMKGDNPLAPNEERALEILRSSGAVGTVEMMEQLSLSERGAQTLLNRLIDKGLVERIGASRATRYRLATPQG